MKNIVTYMRERTKKGFYVNYALTQEEREDLIKECGINGLVLFEYYLRMASIGNVELNDKDAAKYFCQVESTITRWRRSLINKGFVHIDKFHHPHTKQQSIVYYLGRDQVEEYKARIASQ